MLSYKDVKGGKNFDYTLENVGMTASAKSGKYTLRMPSYVDGRICCDNDYCQNNLNKNYPKCDELPNFIEGNKECAAYVPGGGDIVGCTEGATQTAACTNNCGDSGVKTSTCESGHWSGWGACSVADKASCGCTSPAQTTQTETVQCGCTNSGTKTHSKTFDTKSCAWGDWSAWSACTEKETDCEELVGTEPVPAISGCNDSHSEGEVTPVACECGEGARTWHCGSDTNYAWTSTVTKGCEPKPATEEPCPGNLKGGPVTITYVCTNGKWYISGKNVDEVCKNDEVDCVPLVKYTHCKYMANDSSYTYYRSLPSCSNYHIGEGSFVALGEVSGPFCSLSSGMDDSTSCVSYLTPGSVKKCKSSQITNIRDNRH